MEGIEGHLSRRLSNWLSSNSSNIFTWVHNWLHVFKEVHLPECLSLQRLEFYLRSWITLWLNYLASRIFLDVVLELFIHFLWNRSKILQRMEGWNHWVPSVLLQFMIRHVWLLFQNSLEFLFARSLITFSSFLVYFVHNFLPVVISDQTGKVLF